MPDNDATIPPTSSAAQPSLKKDDSVARRKSEEPSAPNVASTRSRRRFAGIGAKDDDQDIKVIHDANYILLLDDVRKEITSWAKGRLWIVAIVSVIVGGLGGYHVFEEAMRTLVESRVNAQIETLRNSSDRTIVKFDSAYDKYSEQLAALKSTNDTAIAVSKEAQARLVISQQQLDKLSQQAKDVESSLITSQSKIQNMITEDANIAHDGTFETASQNDLISGIQNIEFVYLEDRLSTIEQAVKQANDSSSDADKIKSVLRILVEQTSQLKKDFEGKRGHIIENSRLKVILYVRNEPYLISQALRASNQLRGLGYKVDLWKTHQSAVAEARKDIEKDFKGAEDAIEAVGSGILMSDKAMYHSNEIKDALSGFYAFGKVQVRRVDMVPDEVFRQREPEEPYAVSDIILIPLINYE